ncbi:MAG: hypothetical protein AAGK97_17515, partial [Bacteroidota bacterium]
MQKAHEITRIFDLFEYLLQNGNKDQVIANNSENGILSKNIESCIELRNKVSQFPLRTACLFDAFDLSKQSNFRMKFLDFL